MRYFTVEYEVWTRPWFRKGRPVIEHVTFAANDTLELLTMSRDYLKEFGRRKAKFLGFKEIQLAHSELYGLGTQKDLSQSQDV